MSAARALAAGEDSRPDPVEIAPDWAVGLALGATATPTRATSAPEPAPRVRNPGLAARKRLVGAPAVIVPRVVKWRNFLFTRLRDSETFQVSTAPTGDRCEALGYSRNKAQEGSDGACDYQCGRA